MKFKKPNEKSLLEAGAFTGGAIAGGLASSGTVAAITPADATDNTKTMIRAGLVIAGVVLASAVNGDDAGANAVRGAGVGMAVAQSVELVKGFAKTNTTLATAAAGTTRQAKFISGAFGLGCACNDSGLNGSRRRKTARLRMPMPEHNFMAPEVQVISLDPIQAAINRGQYSA